jgi:hypothetical protein
MLNQLDPANPQLAIGVAAFHAPGLVNGRGVVVVPEHVASDGLVDVTKLIRRAIMHDQLVADFLQAELVSNSFPLLRSLEPDSEGVVDPGLHFQELA